MRITFRVSSITLQEFRSGARALNVRLVPADNPENGRAWAPGTPQGSVELSSLDPRAGEALRLGSTAVLEIAEAAPDEGEQQV